MDERNVKRKKGGVLGRIEHVPWFYYLYDPIRSILGKSKIIVGLMGLNSAHRSCVVIKNADVVIEGYPRSGNTFSKAGFLFNGNNSNVNLRSHFHLIGNVKRAVSYNIPCMILIRHPLGAVSSFLVMRGGKTSPRQLLLEYIAFYEFVRKQRDHLFIVKFEEITSDYGAVIHSFNQRYHTSFDCFEHTSQNEQECLQSIYGKGYSVQERKIGRADAESLLRSKHQELLNRAEYIYNQVLKDFGKAGS